MHQPEYAAICEECDIPSRSVRPAYSWDANSMWLCDECRSKIETCDFAADNISLIEEWRNSSEIISDAILEAFDVFGLDSEKVALCFRIPEKAAVAIYHYAKAVR